MALTRVTLERFTAFNHLDLALSPGVNVLIGANGTGKTHLLKVCYAACSASWEDTPFGEKLVSVFLPSRRAIGRLVRRQQGGGQASIGVYRDGRSLAASFSTRMQNGRSARLRGIDSWKKLPITGIYIPVKEMLANAPGFRSLYATTAVHFEEVYNDILHWAYLPQMRGRPDPWRRSLLNALREAAGGRVSHRNEEFFFYDRNGEVEFSLLAEGLRKLALLWLLIQNGTLSAGSALFWDEPETNLNPSMYERLVKVLLELQRNGVQILLATHDYVILKEIDLQAGKDDQVAFHALHHDAETGEIACHSTDSYLDIHPNAIGEAFDSLYDRETERTLKGLGR